MNTLWTRGKTTTETSVREKSPGELIVRWGDQEGICALAWRSPASSGGVENVGGGAGEALLIIDGRRVPVVYAWGPPSPRGRTLWLHFDGHTHELIAKPEDAPRAGGGAGLAAEGRVESHMPGQVRALPVAVGARVAQGDTVVVMESMKMEIRLAAPIDGVLSRLTVVVGAVVERGALLAEITPVSETLGTPEEKLPS